MIERFARLPDFLAKRSRLSRLGPTGVPGLLAHPDWQTPAPAVVWLHGRTVSKEIDPGRYLRWVRAGLAVCAVDLPGHGERFDARFQSPTHSLELLEQVVPEIDGVVAALADPKYGAVFDSRRLGLGGMSAGGMGALRRLCDPHPFVCAAVEATTGWLEGLYFPERVGLPPGDRGPVEHPPDRVAALDPMRHLAGFRPIPLLVLHSEADRVVPFAGMRAFIERLREHYRGQGADPSLIDLRTWPETGAPQEHIGFGRFSNDAKNAQTDFLRRWLTGG